MSDDEAEESTTREEDHSETEGAVDETLDKSSGEPDDERPPIEEDERADIDLSDVDLDAVDEEEADDQEETDEDADEESDDERTVDISKDSDQTWGDMYTDILSVVLIAIVDEYGDGDRQITAEDIEELANQPPIALNEQADRCMEQMGGTRDLPPGQALVVGSSVVGATVLLRETDVAEDVVGELAAGLGGESA